MSNLEGKMLTCDRCRKQVFLEKQDEKTLDGGYTKVPLYRSKPAGWILDGGKDMCPDCANIFREIMHTFWNEHQGEEVGDGGEK